VMPIWFLLYGEDIVFTTHSHTGKGPSIRSGGRVSLCGVAD
jgi:hypothetical protein